METFKVLVTDPTTGATSEHYGVYKDEMDARIWANMMFGTANVGSVAVATSIETKVEIYERALDALIELSQFEGGHLTAAINHIRINMPERP